MTILHLRLIFEVTPKRMPSRHSTERGSAGQIQQIRQKTNFDPALLRSVLCLPGKPIRATELATCPIHRAS